MTTIHGFTLGEAMQVLEISASDREYFVLRSLFSKKEIENTNLYLDCEEMRRSLRKASQK